MTVDPRPDPALDPEVRGIVSSQVDSARRFADTQITNFHRRLEQIRDGSNQDSNGLNLNLGFAGDDRRLDPRTELQQRLGYPIGMGGGWEGDTLSGGSPEDDGSSLPGQAIRSANLGQLVNGPSRVSGEPSAMGLWAAGSVDWGRRDGATGERDYRFSTSGLSAGADVKLTDHAIVGVGMGYGFDRTHVGSNESLSEGQTYVGAVYGSWRAADDLVLEGVLGYGSLDYDSRRWVAVANAFAFGERAGRVTFGSASAELERRSSTMDWAPYGRVQAKSVSLDSFTETGAGIHALGYNDLEFQSLMSVLGARFQWPRPTAHGQFTPTARLEWRHEFNDADSQIVRYADWLASPLYSVPLDAWSRDQFEVNLGANWRMGQDLDLTIDYRGIFGTEARSHGLQVRMRTRF